MKKRVLVVEDDERIRKVVRIILTCDELEVDEAAGGQEALDSLAAGTYDLVVLDLMMPDVDGMQVLQKIRSTPGLAEVPVIVVTAKSSDADIMTGFRQGANYYITKPFEPRELVDSVELILGVKVSA
ncbi:MAG TPA: response regulator [Candidatus Nitrosotenuis sp.]|nr:response regulator [Candidatus Nitrosotenuis sp.]